VVDSEEVLVVGAAVGIEAAAVTVAVEAAAVGAAVAVAGAARRRRNGSR